jgi:uncharacterized protein (DUF2461 family)
VIWSTVKEPFSKVGGKTSQHTRLSKSTIGWKKIVQLQLVKRLENRKWRILN